ncbi:MAG: hypothetical protein K0R29_1668 [Pseudobdellovibrio sp.]|jgi:uncharacterized membrane protein|nr:hypothetical protein [Pseudobdellovibrio sp.]
MKINNLLLAFVLNCIWLAGCNISRDQQPMVLDPPETQLKAEELDFKTVSKFVFEPSCIGCHKAGSSSGGVNLDTYENVFKKITQIKLEVAGGLMPPGKPLNQLQVQLLNKWIDAGAKEFAGSQPPPQSPSPGPSPQPDPHPGPPPDEVTYVTVADKVFKTSCTGCHSTDGGNMGGINLETYESVFQERDSVQAAVEEGRMPPSDMGLSLTQEQKSLLLRWLGQGAKP